MRHTHSMTHRASCQVHTTRIFETKTDFRHSSFTTNTWAAQMHSRQPTRAHDWLEKFFTQNQEPTMARKYSKNLILFSVSEIGEAAVTSSEKEFRIVGRIVCFFCLEFAPKTKMEGKGTRNVDECEFMQRMVCWSSVCVRVLVCALDRLGIWLDGNRWGSFSLSCTGFMK